MDLGLHGLTAFITGASGGIGRALADAFGTEGANVVAHAHTGAEPLRAWLATRPWRERALGVTADMRRPDELDAAFAQARERFGSVGICVANAGARPKRSTPLSGCDETRLRATVEANLLGAMFTARAFLQALPPNPRGVSLLFIGSTAASFGEAGHADYAAAKAGLAGLVKSLKTEVAGVDPRGRVNLIEPGWTKTHVPRPALEDLEQLRRVAQTMPLRRLAEAGDVARTALWLCSPVTGRHLTGLIVPVAGGMEGRVLWQPDEIDPHSVRDG